MYRATSRAMFAENDVHVSNGATKFYFSKPGSCLIRNAFVRLQKDLTAPMDLDDLMLYYSTKFRCNSNTHTMFCSQERDEDLTQN